MWTAVDHALAALIDSVRTLQIGSRLPNLMELSANLGVSHVIVREALEVLEAEGIVEVRQGRNGGIYVTGASGFPVCLRRLYSDLKPDDVPALIEARRILEREVTLLAATRATDEDLEPLEVLVQDMGSTELDAEVLVELSVRFHLRLAQIAGNPQLARYMRDVLNRMAAVGVATSLFGMAPNQFTGARQIYRDLYQALRSGDEDAIRTVVERHLSMLSDVAEHPRPIRRANHSQTRRRTT